MNSILRLGDYNVPGYSLNVTGNMDIRTSDASGETSSTDEVDKGTKGKTLTVALNILFSREADLRGLIRVAEAKDNGSRRIYTIANATANAAGIRQVRFAERVTWQEQEGLRAWAVSFTLREYLSNPERVEQREEKTATVAQTSDGTATESERPAETAATVEQPATGLERLLQRVDDFLK